MDKLFKRNYDAVVKRNLITEHTTDDDFKLKAKEELAEVQYALWFESDERVNEEIADFVVVGINWLINRGVDIPEILTKIAEKNEARSVKV